MFIYFIVNVLLTFQLSYSIDGPNVCTKESKQFKKVNVPAKLPFEVKTFKWCAEIPFRCPQTRIEYRDSFLTQIKEVTFNESICCPGYAEFNDRCIPVCSSQCIHGICIEPNKCDCEAGWSGDVCNIWYPCPDGKSGNNCSSQCNCRNGATCDAVSGICECKPGWTGKDCSKPCLKGYFGLGCSQKCICLNEGACNPITGECKCRAGFKGEYCQDDCAPNELDPECNRQGLCANNGIRNAFTGECECQPGYIGTHCENPCPSGTYGYGCSKECKCPSYDCDHEFGCRSSRMYPIPIQSASFYRDEGFISVNPILLTVSCLLLLIVCLALLALLRYRRRVKDLSKERAYVTYVANKDASDQFENPVYSFENSLGDKLRPLSFPLPSPINDLSLCNKKWDKHQFSGLESNSPSHQPFRNQSPHSYHRHDHPRTSYDQGCSSNCRLNICDQASNLYVNQELSKSSDSLYKEPIYAEIRSKDFEDDHHQIPDHYDRPRPINKILNNDLNHSSEHI
ncbi:protein draper isoform X1 [Tetranychus urticae]|uniref:protein draper isoform X1 n=1 Tax=Tetranychus urticae TaxID=32264 RepID=UPI00077BB370|nr:protein draper isoform X1 [Tetranychus urticae]